MLEVRRLRDKCRFPFIFVISSVIAPLLLSAVIVKNKIFQIKTLDDILFIYLSIDQNVYD